MQGHWKTLQASQLGRRRLHLICLFSIAQESRNRITDLPLATGLAVHCLTRFDRRTAGRETVDADLRTRHGIELGERHGEVRERREIEEERRRIREAKEERGVKELVSKRRVDRVEEMRRSPAGVLFFLFYRENIEENTHIL